MSDLLTCWGGSFDIEVSFTDLLRRFIWYWDLIYWPAEEAHLILRSDLLTCWGGSFDIEVWFTDLRRFIWYWDLIYLPAEEVHLILRSDLLTWGGWFDIEIWFTYLLRRYNVEVWFTNLLRRFLWCCGLTLIRRPPKHHRDDLWTLAPSDSQGSLFWSWTRSCWSTSCRSASTSAKSDSQLQK